MRGPEPERFPALAEIMRRVVLDRGNGSMNRIARKSEIDNATLGKMLEGKRPRAEIIARVAIAFPDLTEQLYEATGYEVPISLHPVVRQVAEETGRAPMDIVDEAVRKMFDGDRVG